MSPELELQGVIRNQLKADPQLTALIEGRVYDQAPKGAPFPCVSFGPSQAVSDDADCLTGFTVTIQLDAWSRAVGFPEVKRIADAVRDALHGRDDVLALTVNALVSFEHVSTDTRRAEDGLSSRAIMFFDAAVERR